MAGVAAVSSRTRWRSQIFSNRVEGRDIRCAPNGRASFSDRSGDPGRVDVLALVLMVAVHDADHGLGGRFDDVGRNTGALVAAGADGGAHGGAALGVAAAGHRADLELLHV